MAKLFVLTVGCALPRWCQAMRLGGCPGLEDRISGRHRLGKKTKHWEIHDNVGIATINHLFLMVLIMERLFFALTIILIGGLEHVLFSHVLGIIKYDFPIETIKNEYPQNWRSIPRIGDKKQQKTETKYEMK